MTYVIEPTPRVSIPVTHGGGLFPVNKIYCVGRNYAEHAIEMGADPDRELPFFFMKPGYAVLTGGVDMIYPNHSKDVHHEVELVVALAKGGSDISVADAMTLVFGYGVGVDMTRRDLQGEAKEDRRPWEAGKTFRHAAPCSDLVPIAESNEINSGAISLSINGQVRQSGDINQMIWKVPEVISRLSELFFLQPGDLIFTGTPAGVGPVHRGDLINASIVDVISLSFRIGSS